MDAAFREDRGCRGPGERPGRAGGERRRAAGGPAASRPRARSDVHGPGRPAADSAALGRRQRDQLPARPPPVAVRAVVDAVRPVIGLLVVDEVQADDPHPWHPPVRASL